MKRERGVAAVTAVLIVAVAASAAALMLAQQSAMLDQTALVAARAQADFFARAGLDWSRGILAQDAITSPGYDGLDEDWAQPIAGLPVERAVVSGALADEQGKFNLNNLVGDNFKTSGPDVLVFQRLLTLLNLPVELSDAVVDWIDNDSDISGNGGAENPFYLALPKPYRAANRRMVQVEELYRLRGFDAATVAKLRPYVTALPTRTPVNANTASDLVLEALLPTVPKEKIVNLVASRRFKPLKDPKMLSDWAPEAAALGPAVLDVKSSFFSVRIQVAQDDVQLAVDALLERAQQGSNVKIDWQRPRY